MAIDIPDVDKYKDWFLQKLKFKEEDWVLVTLTGDAIAWKRNLMRLFNSDLEDKVLKIIELLPMCADFFKNGWSIVERKEK